jgi:hypothetical protein
MRACLATLCLLLISTFSFARDIQGVVVTANGHPRPHAYLWSDPEHRDFELRSDADGRFVLKNVSTTQPAWTAGSDMDKKFALFSIPADTDTVRATLDYDPAAAEGRVVDAHGHGITGLKVVTELHRGQEIFPLGTEKTDGGGYFETWLAAGEGLSITARVMDGTKELAAVKPLALTRNPIAIELPDIVIASPPPGAKIATKDTRQRIGGIVQDETGKPIDGVRVELSWQVRNQMGMMGAETRTDDKGRWSRRVPIDVNDLSFRLYSDRYVSTVLSQVPHAAAGKPDRSICDQRHEARPRVARHRPR